MCITKYFCLLFCFMLYFKEKCNCSEVKRSGWSNEKINWSEPNITCPYRFSLKNITTPLQSSPHQFSTGDHVLDYVYNLYGGQRVICSVYIHVGNGGGGGDFCDCLIPWKYCPRCKEKLRC